VKKVIILTGAELRHQFFRQFLASSNDIEVIHSYCESNEKNLNTFVEKVSADNDMRKQHLTARKQSEEDFFRLFVDKTMDHSNPVFIPRGEINTGVHSQNIINSGAELLIAYGCSIIKDPLLSAFKNKFINVHLGLSPYYRGSGTNFWPLVNKEPEFVGATFMYIDEGIDTGEIIHQIRARYFVNDTPSSIGNRFISDMAYACEKLIKNFDGMEKMPQIANSASDRVYKRKAYTEDSVNNLYDHFNHHLVADYLSEEKSRCEKVPIIVNPGMEEVFH
jgi:phosphoribosylglycinamide formyltransferase 1